MTAGARMPLWGRDLRRIPEAPPEALRPLAEAAGRAGLALRAVLPAEALPAGTARRVEEWLAAGRAGDMDYLARAAGILPDPRRWKPWARSVLLFTAAYPREAGSFRGGGRVARYALGRDYHHLLGRRLERLGRELRAAGLAGRWRAVTDAAPLLERELALKAGLGFRGKNTLVLDPELGPWLLLGELLVDAELPEWASGPPAVSCGSCTRCLAACPTSAFPAPYLLEPRRCISYLTIEHRGAIPRELRPLLGDWVFGCDVCLEVCPFGTHAPDHSAPWGLLPALAELSLEDLLALSPAAFARRFRGSPLRRPGRAGLLRNACLVLGNLGRGARALEAAVADPEPMVRGHAAWALGRLGHPAPLRRALAGERDPDVRVEIEAALGSDFRIPPPQPGNMEV